MWYGSLMFEDIFVWTLFAVGVVLAAWGVYDIVRDWRRGGD